LQPTTQTEVARLPFSQAEAFAQFMTPFRSVSQAQFTEWSYKEKMTDLRVITRASEVSPQKTLRLISLGICVTTLKT
jgi:hypothetical protein